MPENPKTPSSFFSNTTPTASEPKSNEPATPSGFFNSFGKQPVTKQDINLAMQDAPILLDNNEEFTLETDKYETKYQSDFKDKVNSFWQGVDETQKSANEYDITKAQLKIANNNKLLKTLNPNDPQALELIQDNYKQLKELESATEDKVANQKEIDDEYVSKKYKLNQALVQGQGSEAGFFDKMAYTMPNMIGSSTSLIIPNLIATFGTKAGATLAAAALAKAGMEGSKSSTAGAVLALTGALGGIAVGRHFESKSEVGGQISSNIEQLSQRYIDDVYNKTGEEITKESIPQDAMDDIVIQANQGREELYYKNMMLAGQDMAEALLFAPKLNLFGANKLSKLANKAVDYNKYTRLGTKAAKFGAVYESEKFEEGSQYAYGKRQEDFALNGGIYEDKGFIKNLISDSEDVLSSMNFSPIGEVRGSGRYADDKQFQTAEESGGMLAAIMGGVQTTAGIAKDLNTYRKVNKELQDDGVFNVDDKYFKLKDQILQKHFENGTTHHLLEGVKNLIGKKNEEGTEILTKEQAREEIDKVQKAFDTYQEVNSQVNEIEKKGAFLMFDSAEQKVAKKAVKDDLFHVSLQLNREQKDLDNLTIKRNNIQNTINNPALKDYNNINDLIEKQKDLIEKLKSFDPVGLKENFNIPFRIKYNEEKLKKLEETKNTEEAKLKELGIDFKIEPLTIAEQELNKQIIAKSSLLEEQVDKYKKLLEIKDAKSLQDWYTKQIKTKSSIKENINATEAKKQHTNEIKLKEEGTAVTDFSEYEDYSEQQSEQQSGEELWYENITDKNELLGLVNQGLSSGQLTEQEATDIVNDWKAKQKAKTSDKTDWNNIILNAVSDRELDKIMEQIDSKGVMSEKLMDSIGKKRESLKQSSTEDSKITEKLSNGVTNAFDDNLNTDEKLESNTVNNETSNKEFVSKRSNALMMKFYQFIDKTKKWARHTSGELKGQVIEESNPGVSIEVNKSDVATEGSEVTYVHNGKDISLVDSSNRVIGFLGLAENAPDVNAGADVINAYNELVSIREYVLSKSSGTVKTTVLVKGHGKLLTKMIGNLPILDQSISLREEDMIEGRPLFLYDDGVGLVNKNLTEAQAKVAEQFQRSSFADESGVGQGRVYQVIKTANGSWFVIPVYTKLIGEVNNSKEVINNIISILKGAIVDGKTIDYNKALQQLNKYIFATNTINYKGNLQALRISEDKDHQQEGTIKVGVVKLTFNDILTGNKIEDLKKAISEVRHNLSVNDLGTIEEDSKLIENNVLVTNAYTDTNGQYYVQPYIEVNNPEGYVKPEIEVESIKATTSSNIFTTQSITDTQVELEKWIDKQDINGNSLELVIKLLAKKNIDKYTAYQIIQNISRATKNHGSKVVHVLKTFWDDRESTMSQTEKNILQKYDIEITTLEGKPVETIKRKFVNLENTITNFELEVQDLFNNPTIEKYNTVISNYEFDLSADLPSESLRKDIESKLKDVKNSFEIITTSKSESTKQEIVPP